MLILLVRPRRRKQSKGVRGSASEAVAVEDALGQGTDERLAVKLPGEALLSEFDDFGNVERLACLPEYVFDNIQLRRTFSRLGGSSRGGRRIFVAEAADSAELSLQSGFNGF